METASDHGAGYWYLDEGMAEGVQKDLIMELHRQAFLDLDCEGTTALSTAVTRH